MKRKGSSLLCGVSCGGRKSLRTESQKTIEEILKEGLATIREEPQVPEEMEKPAVKRHQTAAVRKVKRDCKLKLGRLVMHQLAGLGESYVHLMVGAAGKRNFAGLLSC